MFDARVRSAAHIACATVRLFQRHWSQPAPLGHGFHRRINALISPTLTRSRDCDCADCAFDGAYFRITASWRSSEPDVPHLPTTRMGGDGVFGSAFGSRVGINTNRAPARGTRRLTLQLQPPHVERVR